MKENIFEEIMTENIPIIIKITSPLNQGTKWTLIHCNETAQIHWKRRNLKRSMDTDKMHPENKKIISDFSSEAEDIRR